jgi:hypothetical protein
MPRALAARQQLLSLHEGVDIYRGLPALFRRHISLIAIGVFDVRGVILRTPSFQRLNALWQL